MTTTDGIPETDVTHYTISDHGFFLGTVALLNSLRLTGNLGELVVLDAGLTPNERDLLAAHGTVFAPPKEVDGHPSIMKPYPHLLEPCGVIVLIDSDMIVTGSLDHVFELARDGRICAYPESKPRWFAEWHKVLKLPHPASPPRST